MSKFVSFINNLKAEYIFLLIGGLFGMLLLVTTPVFQVPDEPMHLLRACEVSELILHNNKDGDMTKDFLPNRKSILTKNYARFKELKNEKHYTDLFEFKNLNYLHNNSGYSFILYLPAAISLKLASSLNSNPYFLFYIARLFNLVTWLALTFSAIKLTPFKWQFLICALFPMTIYEGMSISADSINLGFCFLYIAFISNLAYTKERIEIKEILALSFATILSVFFKGAILFSFLIFLIPSHKLKLKYWIFPLLISICILLQSFISSNSFILTANGVNINERKLLLLNQPLYVLKLFLNTFIHKASFYLQSAIFRLGWLEIKPNPLPVLILFITYLSGSLIDKIKVETIDKIMALLINLSFIVLTTLLYFLTFSPLENNIIIGAQGRYFIPLFSTFAIVTQNKFLLKEVQISYLKLGILAIIVLNLIYAIQLIKT